MKVSIQDGKTCEKILKIEVRGEDIQKEYEEFYDAVIPKAKIPGFRPGRAPRHVVAMHYKEEAKEQVLKNLITESYRRALQEKSLEPIGFPAIEEVNFKEDQLSYRARVEIRPKIKLSKTSGLAAKKETAEVKPEEVEASVKRIQESLAQYKAVEDRAAQMGDCVIADYVCLVDGKEIEKRGGDWFELKEDEYLKGFSKQLVGANLGEERELHVSFPEDAHQKEIAGKPAVFKVKVLEIKSKILPAIDDEMAKEMGEFKTLAELKERIEKDLVQSRRREKEAAYEKALLEELVRQNKIDLPEGLVARRLDRLVSNALEDFRRHGSPPESKLEELAKKLKVELAPEARKQVHVAFLLDEIAVKENISVSEEELKEKYVMIAAQVRQPVEEVEKYYAGDEDTRESLRDQVRSEKVIEFLKKNARA